MRFFKTLRLPATLAFVAIVLAGPHRVLAAGYVEKWTEVRRFDAAEATQAAAADERFVYAVSNTVVAKYDRATGKLVSRSAGEASHLNSGFLFGGKIYCAHSNYPHKPERSDIRVLDPDKMTLQVFHEFGDSAGSLTWAVQAKGSWWCNFAYYKAENHKTYVARYDNWREVARWNYPTEVIKAFGTHSASCGIWRGDYLLVTGHDDREILVLELPNEGTVLRHVATVPAPFTGQGFAADPVTDGLVGIDRKRREIIFAR